MSRLFDDLNVICFLKGPKKGARKKNKKMPCYLAMTSVAVVARKKKKKKRSLVHFPPFFWGWDGRNSGKNLCEIGLGEEVCAPA